MRYGPAEDKTAQGFAPAMLSGALILIGDYDIASTVAEGAARRARETGSMVAQAQASQTLANVRWHQGRLLDAVRLAEAACEVSHQGWNFFSTLAVPTLAFAELLRGRNEAAHAAVRLGEQLGADRPEHALVLFARGRLAMAEGAPERALSDFQAAGLCDFESYGMEHPTWLPWRPYAALAAHASGSRTLAHELAESGLALARPFGMARPIGHALGAAGQVVGGEEGLTMLMEAVAVLEESQSTLEHANALVALGTALRRSGRSRDARLRLQEGQRIAYLCGAAPLVEQARARSCWPRGPIPARSCTRGPASSRRPSVGSPRWPRRARATVRSPRSSSWGPARWRPTWHAPTPNSASALVASSLEHSNPKWRTQTDRDTGLLCGLRQWPPRWHGGEGGLGPSSQARCVLTWD